MRDIIINELSSLIERFDSNINDYKNSSNSSYNEHTCRLEYIDHFLKLLGWDVYNEQNQKPQYREVLTEEYATKTDRPDYTLTLRGLPKIFVEAKKPSVDVVNNPKPALQCRKYGWNSGLKISILTNFEYFIIYDTTYIPNENDDSTYARYKLYHYKEYIEKFEEIHNLVSRDFVYSGKFEEFMKDNFKSDTHKKQPVDLLFLSKINKWRLELSNELYHKYDKYKDLNLLNESVQNFINRIIFLRICEDKNLPIYYNLSETISCDIKLHKKMEELFREADKRYNSGIFNSGIDIFDISSSVIIEMIEELYYPKSPYMFNIIEPNLLGKVYELFLTETIQVDSNNKIILAYKNECLNRSIVTTPTEIVKFMVEQTLIDLCDKKTPDQIMQMKFCDISCGSGVFLEEIFDFIQKYIVDWYVEHNIHFLEKTPNGMNKLPLDFKKKILCNCIYGIDIDYQAVEVAKFSLLVKLIEEESEPSIRGVNPVLPNLEKNILFGNSLISSDNIVELVQSSIINESVIEASKQICPFNWSEFDCSSFDLIIGNPPYVSTEHLKNLLSEAEFSAYKELYSSCYKQFDKYYVFVEQALKRVKNGGYVSYIIPNKFIKNDSGKELRKLISANNYLKTIYDFGDNQLFEDKTIYSSIVTLKKENNVNFEYTYVKTPEQLWIGESNDKIQLSSRHLSPEPWVLSTDIEMFKLLESIENSSDKLSDFAHIFNGIQTSAEKPVPVYWFSNEEVVDCDYDYYTIMRDGKKFKIEKSILKPYFKPLKKNEKNKDTYSLLNTNKHIIFPYDSNGKLIDIDVMKSNYPHVFEYLLHYYDRLVPKSIDKNGSRDVSGATVDTWYQYGRSQALSIFNNTPKLIVGILTKKPMYTYDDSDMLIQSGGTAGYCAIAKKHNSPYELEYIQAWLTNPKTERIIKILGSDFEGGFVSRGTFILSKLPFIRLDFDNIEQKAIHDKIVELTREIYTINKIIDETMSEQEKNILLRTKESYIDKIEKIIYCVYDLEFKRCYNEIKRK